MNIKQKSLLYIFIYMIGILVGCSKEEDNTRQVYEQCGQAGYFESNCRIAEYEAGDYLMDLSYPYAISVIEKEQEERIYLCGKPECAHQNDMGGVLTTCNSYVGEIIFSSLVFHDEWLYMLLYDQQNYTVSLSRISIDGTIHEMIGVIDQAPYNGNNISYLIVGDKVYYTRMPDWDDSTTTSSILEMSLSTKKSKIIYSYDSSNSGIMSLKYFNNCLYFREYNNGIGMLSRIDITTGVKETLSDTNVSSYTINAIGYELLYWVPSEGMYKMGLEDLHSKLIRKGNDSNLYIELACDDKYIYLSNYLNANLYGETSEGLSITILNLDGEQVEVISLNDFWCRPLCVTGERIYVEAIVPDEGRGFAFIEKDKLPKQNFEWIMIRKR